MKIQDLPLSGLIAYQQIIEMRTIHLMESWEEIQGELQKQLISQSWASEALKSIRTRVERNEVVAKEVSKEVDLRVKKVFGGEVSPASYIDRLRVRLIEEKKTVQADALKRSEEGGNLLKKRKNKSVVKLDTSVSSEKKVD